MGLLNKSNGLGIGLLVAPVLYLLALIIELFNCLTCGVFITNCPFVIYSTNLLCIADNNALTKSWCDGPFGDVPGIFPIWNGGYFFNAFIFCTIIGAVTGAIYGITKYFEEQLAAEAAEKRAREAREAAERKAREEKEAAEKRAREEKEAAERRVREGQFAADFKSQLFRTINGCKQNAEKGEKIRFSPQYECVSLQERVWKAVNEASIPLQRLQDLVEGFTTIQKEEQE
jgi:hypothetical protein